MSWITNRHQVEEVDAPEVVTNAARRIAADVTATTSLDVETTFWLHQDPRGSLFSFELKSRGRTIGVVGQYGEVDEEEAFLVGGLANFQSDVIEFLGAAWPICSLHGRHPLVAHIASEQAAWQCPITTDVIVRVGYLRPGGVPEPAVPAGRVRWWNSEGGYGAISDPDGDVWALFAHIEGVSGYRSLEEDEVVTYEVDTGRQGSYRRALWVRPARPPGSV